MTAQLFLQSDDKDLNYGKMLFWLGWFLKRCLWNGLLGPISLAVYELLIKILYDYLLLILHDKWSSDQVPILHMSWQLSCHDMCKFVIWLKHKNTNYSSNDFHKILIMSSKQFVEWTPGLFGWLITKHPSIIKHPSHFKHPSFLLCSDKAMDLI